MPCAPAGGHADAGGEKTAAAIQVEIAREITTLLARVFAERKQTAQTDLEAVEMALRAARHRAGAVFTQTAWDEEGFAIRDPDSTT